VKGAEELAATFSRVDVSTHLSFGDLLEGEVGQRHPGALLSVARRIWPRWAIKRFLQGRGLILLIEAQK
jgi:hypothetical protein